MDKAPRVPRFLEPIYINEPMVLNCAAYLFKGFALESEEVNTATGSQGILAKAGIPYLSSVIGLSAGVERRTSHEARANRRFTVGGLHMNVLDQLYEQGMVMDLSAISDEALAQSAILDKYVHVHVILRATEYWSALQVLSTSAPLLAQLVQDYGDQISASLSKSSEIDNLKSVNLSKYVDSMQAIVTRLLDDYLTSGQLEMVMWLDMRTPLGIVDLQVEDYDPQKLKAALVGGKYHVYGKITARASTGQKLSLLQRTSLFELQELFARLLALIDAAEQDADSQEAARDSTKKAREAISSLAKQLQILMRTELNGPVVRMVGMSVCV